MKIETTETTTATNRLMRAFNLGAVGVTDRDELIVRDEQTTWVAEIRDINAATEALIGRFGDIDDLLVAACDDEAAPDIYADWCGEMVTGVEATGDRNLWERIEPFIGRWPA